MLHETPDNVVSRCPLPLAGYGNKRPRVRKAAREKIGTEGEDVVADPSGGLKLRMPMRMGIGTVKAAAWHVRHLVLCILRCLCEGLDSQPTREHDSQSGARR